MSLRSEIARIISLVFNPYLFAIVIILLGYVGKGYEGIYEGLASAILVGIPPLIAHILIARKYELDWFIQSHRKRCPVLLTTTLGSFVAFLVFRSNSTLALGLLSFSIASLIVGIVSLVERVSIHSTTVMISALLLGYVEPIIFPLLLLLAIVVMWSRLELKEHNLEQVLEGVAVALLAFTASVIICSGSCGTTL